MFEKFLNQPKPDPAQQSDTPKRKPHQGNPKPDHLRKYPKRVTERHDPVTKRVKKELRKRSNTGNKHWTVKRKKAREHSKRIRVATGYRYVKAYNASFWRKYLQNRSWNRSVARRRGLDPDAYYQITFADWIKVWESVEEVWKDGRFYKAQELQDNPVKRKGECTWFARRDESGVFSMPNVCVYYRGKELKLRSDNDTPLDIDS